MLGNTLKQIVRNSNGDNPLPQEYHCSMNYLSMNVHLRINLPIGQGCLLIMNIFKAAI